MQSNHMDQENIFEHLVDTQLVSKHSVENFLEL